MCALYGTIQASLIFWKDLTKTLVSEGFEVNPYDWCIANKTINGKQLTVVWHVDNLEILHVDKRVVGQCIDMLDKRYGNDIGGKPSPLTVKRGKKHDYLGMLLDYSVKGKVKIDMRKYIETILEELPSGFDVEAVTPAASYLFDVNEACRKLNQSDSDKCHHAVAQLLFLCKQARPDIQTTVAFLTTRVKGPDEDDLKINMLY